MASRLTRSDILRIMPHSKCISRFISLSVCGLRQAKKSLRFSGFETEISVLVADIDV